MNKIILTTIAAALLSTTALASVSKEDKAHAVMTGNSAVCNTLESFEGINQSSLYPANKCWLDVHSDKSAGADFGAAWVKIDGKYYDVPLSALRKAGSKTAAKDLFKSSIVAQVSDAQIAEFTSSVSVDIADTQVAIAVAISTLPAFDSAEFVAAQAEIANLNVTLTLLKGSNAALTGDIAGLEAAKVTLENRVTTLESIRTATQADIDANWVPRSEFNRLGAAYAEKRDTLLTTQDNLDAANRAVATVTAERNAAGIFLGQNAIQIMSLTNQINVINASIVTLEAAHATEIANINAAHGTVVQLRDDAINSLTAELSDLRGIHAGQVRAMATHFTGQIASLNVQLADTQALLTAANLVIANTPVGSITAPDAAEIVAIIDANTVTRVEAAAASSILAEFNAITPGQTGSYRGVDYVTYNNLPVHISSQLVNLSGWTSLYTPASVAAFQAAQSAIVDGVASTDAVFTTANVTTAVNTLDGFRTGHANNPGQISSRDYFLTGYLSLGGSASHTYAEAIGYLEAGIATQDAFKSAAKSSALADVLANVDLTTVDMQIDAAYDEGYSDGYALGYVNVYCSLHRQALETLSVTS